MGINATPAETKREAMLLELQHAYKEVEIEIGKRIHDVSCQFCQRCLSKCCKEQMCRESVESSFLARLTEQQQERYDAGHGWLGAFGCRLKYGRPLVCHEFFCDQILNSGIFDNSNLEQLIGEFVSIGKRSHKNNHLICVESLDSIPLTKIKKMICAIEDLMAKLLQQ